MSSFPIRTAIAALFTLGVATSAGAQAAAPSDSTTVDSTTVPAAVVTIMAMRSDANVAYRVAPEAAAPAFRRRRAFSRPEVLMIVGGALIVTGLVVGDDAAPILYLAGAGIGGYGLYLYLQSPDTRIRAR